MQLKTDKQTNMKKILVLLFSVIIINIFGQKPVYTQSKIDQKYGLNKFKLGSSFSTFTDLSLIGTEGKLKEYSYSGSDLKTFMGHNVERVLLQFYDNQLYKISIRIGVNKAYDFQKEERELIRKIDLNYGDHDYAPGESTRNIEDKLYKKSGQNSWHGKKCTLYMDTYMIDLKYILKEKADVTYNNYIEFWIMSKPIDKKVAAGDL